MSKSSSIAVKRGVIPKSNSAQLHQHSAEQLECRLFLSAVSFLPQQKTYAINAHPYAVAVADLGNSHPDLVVSNFDDDTVSVLLGNGDDTNYASSMSEAVSVDVIPLSSVALSLRQPVISSAVIAGGKFNAKLPIVLTNNGPAIAGTFTFNIYVDAATSLDGNQVQLMTLTKKFSLKPNKSDNFNVMLKSLPATLAGGTYHILVAMNDPIGAVNLVASTQTVQVTAPFVDLAVSFQGTSFITSASPGDKGTIEIGVLNQGNIPAKGTVAVNLALTASGDNFPFDLQPGSFAVNLLPGKQKTLKLRTTIPAGLPVGSYIITGGFSTVGKLTDSNTANNQVNFSNSPITIAGSTEVGAVFSNFITTSHSSVAGILDEQGTVMVPGGFTADYTFFQSFGLITWQIIYSQLFGNQFSFYTNNVTLFHPIKTLNHKSMTFLSNSKGATGSLVISDDISEANTLLSPGTYFFKIS